jgi:hypothetical protein
MGEAALVPLWLKLGYSAMAIAVLALYWRRYGPRNYLWFSDVALILLVPALWLESAWLASTVAVGTLALELFWNLCFFGRLFGAGSMGGLTDYMFDRQRPLWLRALSLFHVVVPAVTIVLLLRLGYDPRALPSMLLLGWAVLLLSYRFADARENLNWVLGLGTRPQTRIASHRFLLRMVVGYPLLVWLPSHLLLGWLF